jgi:DNA-binding NarL/FixJ family response regulator
MEIKIIITENQKLFRDVLHVALASHGIVTIAEAENGEELLALLLVHQPDVVLLDIEMPIMSGDRALKTISKAFPEIKIIILSQYDEQEIIINYLLNGASAYVNKSADIEVLVEAIQSVKTTGFYYKNIAVPIKELIDKQDNAYSKGANFSRRESEIIPLICEGKTNKAIADELHIVVKTVEAHRKNIYKKTKTSSVTEFIKHSIKKGFSFLIKKE